MTSFAYVSLDTETTGIDTQKDRVVEVACVLVRPGQPKSIWSTLVNPGVPIPEGATAVHGIADADVAGAPSFADVVDDLLVRVSAADAIVGYNARRFDVPLLVAETERAGRSWPAGVPIVDAMLLWHYLQPRSLIGAASYWLGSEHRDAHGAVPDAVMTARVLDAILEKHPQLPSSPAELEAVSRPKGSEHWIDADGKLVRSDDGVRIGFGKHKGTLLADLPRDYLRWVLDTVSLPSLARAHVRRALGGQP